jgi:hypothetical protein
MSAATTACLAASIVIENERRRAAAIIIDDESRRRAEGADDLIDYSMSLDWGYSTMRWWDWLLAAVLIGGPSVAILGIAWYVA